MPVEHPSVSFERKGLVLVDADWRGEGVTEQFLEHASTYDERYSNSPYWNYLVERGLGFAGVDRSKPGRVLDIGSGSGNSVLATLNMLPKAAVVASDISPQLLNILAGHLARGEHAGRNVSLYCFDLHKDVFQAESFDLIIGGAVLHHMVDPYGALRNAAKWLKVGGHIILYEPFDYGAHVFSAMFQLLVDELAEAADENDRRCASLFRALKQDMEARLGVPIVKPWTAKLDDKWFFHLEFLRNLATSLGLKPPRVIPNTDNFDHYFKRNVQGFLNSSGNSDLVLKPNIAAIIDEFDGGIAPSLKRKLALEGIVVFGR